MSINSVTISGNLTRDPELRTTASGMSVLTFCVAVNDRKQNGAGEWVDYPNYIDCTMFGKRAESLAVHLNKGVKVCIAGKLHYSTWGKDGQKRSKVYVTVNDLELMPKAKAQAAPVEAYATIDIPF